MPCDYIYHPQQRLIEIRATGYLTLEERTACVDALIADPDLPRGAPIPVLINVSLVASAPLNVEITGSVIPLVRRLQQRFQSRIAHLTSTVGHVTVSHLIAYIAANEGITMRSFSSETEARQWLGCPAADAAAGEDSEAQIHQDGSAQ